MQAIIHSVIVIIEVYILIRCLLDSTFSAYLYSE